MSESLKHSVLQTVEQKFRLGESVIAVNLIKINLFDYQFSEIIKIFLIQIFEAYQIVGAEHQNRILAVVKSSGRSSALFSFNVANYPPVNLSDLKINSVLPIDETFLIDITANSSGISSHQFQILGGNESHTYFYYPDDSTIRSKENFVRVLRKLIQGMKSSQHKIKARVENTEN